VHVVVNHLHLREALPQASVQTFPAAMQAVVDAGAVAAEVVEVSDDHLILVLTFATADDAQRVAREVGGPWMREHIVPLLAGDTQRSLGKVVASARADA
jgi:hypothetical protein